MNSQLRPEYQWILPIRRNSYLAHAWGTSQKFRISIRIQISSNLHRSTPNYQALQAGTFP